MQPKETNLIERSFKRDFVTQNGQLYTVSFDEEPNGFFSNLNLNTYFINFYSEDFLYDTSIDIKTKYNIKQNIGTEVRQTIIKELALFLSKYPNDVLLFVCENKHNRSRNRLFHRWYKQYGALDFLKLDSSINTGYEIIYSSILINKKNSMKKEIMQAYKQVNKELEK